MGNDSSVDPGFSPGAPGDTSSSTPDTESPTDPSSLILSGIATSSVSQTVTWTGSTDNIAVDHYEVAIGTTAGGADVAAFTNVGTALTYQFTGLSLDPIVDFYFSVKAVDAAGNESAVVSSTTWQYNNVFGSAILTGTQTTAPSTPTDYNQGTAYSIQWSTSSFSSEVFSHDTVTNNHQLTALLPGDYKIALTMPMTYTGCGNRCSVLAEVFVNGTVVSSGITRPSFVRASSGHLESSNHLTFLLRNLSANDIIDVRVMQGHVPANTGTATGTAKLYLEFMNPLRSVFSATATQTTSSTNFNEAAAANIEWTEEREDSDFTHAASSDSITLNTAGDYLAFVNIPTSTVCGSARRNVRLDVQLDGVTVDGGSAGQGYIRCNSNHADASVHWSGIIRGVTASQVLTVQTLAETTDTASVTVTASRTASILLERIDTSSGVLAFRANQLVSGTNWNANSFIEWFSHDIIDAVTYSHTVNTDTVTVNTAGNYMVIYNDYLTGTATRGNPGIFLQVNGVDVTGASCSTHYIRNSGGANDASCSLVFYLEGLSASDTVRFRTEVLAAGGTVNDGDDALFIMIQK